MLKIEKGQKAVIVSNHDNAHSFEVGEEVEFIGYAVIDDEEGYYEYEFINKEEFQQSLIAIEFKLIEVE